MHDTLYEDQMSCCFFFKKKTRRKKNEDKRSGFKLGKTYNESDACMQKQTIRQIASRTCVYEYEVGNIYFFVLKQDRRSMNGSDIDSTSRNPISRWSASTASWRRWRPHGSGGAGGDLGRGAAAIAMSLRSSDNGDDRSDELCYSY